MNHQMNQSLCLSGFAVTGALRRRARRLLVAAGWALALGLVFAGHPAPATPATNRPSGDKVPSTRELDGFRRTVETLRGKEFLRPVPAFDISEKELRAIVDRELEKEYPGRELADYTALMTWLDLLPPGTDLKAVSAAFFVGQVAGLYDSDTKEMCIPAFSTAQTNAWKNPAEKKVAQLPGLADDIVLTHEFTHALEDQYWPFDDAAAKARRESTDREAARSFLAEGSATRLMIEGIPAQAERKTAGTYVPAWNLLHSGAAELVLNLALSQVWKSKDVLTPGVPETLARGETMPYAYGYPFCSGLMRNWGLDGLDYVCDHPPVSTEQVMHPQKAWEWRDFPVRIALPDALAADWKYLTGDCLGEAGIAVLFGCSFTNLSRGERLAQGWDGDRVATYAGPEGRRLLVWASSWDSALDASRFAEAWVKQRQSLHQAVLDPGPPNRMTWTQPDGRAGILVRNGKQVLIFETDQPAALGQEAEWARAITFTQPPEDAARAAANSALLRFNPIFSRRKDADYTVSRTGWGLLTRHDRNSIGASDRLLLGLLGESHRTASFAKWELGWSLVAKHQSDSRRGIAKTALLPWGILYGQLTVKLPYDPARTISRASVLWGLAGSCTQASSGRRSLRLLPGGLLFRSDSGAGRTSVHVLGTGISREHPPQGKTGATRFRLLGIPLWTERPGRDH